jgi:hypothetical protein
MLLHHLYARACPCAYAQAKVQTNEREAIAKPSDTMVGVLALHAIRHATLVTCLLSWALRRREVVLGFRGGTSILLV